MFSSQIEGKRKKTLTFAFKITAWAIAYVLKSSFPSVWGWGREENTRKTANALESEGHEIQNRHRCAGAVMTCKEKLQILMKALTEFFPTSPLQPHVDLASAWPFYKWEGTTPMDSFHILSKSQVFTEFYNSQKIPLSYSFGEFIPRLPKSSSEFNSSVIVLTSHVCHLGQKLWLEVVVSYAISQVPTPFNWSQKIFCSSFFHS